MPKIRPNSRFVVPGPVKKTRFAELRYQHRGDHWRILDFQTYSLRDDPDLAPGIGGEYPTEAALLADLERYAHDYGINPGYHDPDVKLKRIKANVEAMIRTQSEVMILDSADAAKRAEAWAKREALWSVLAMLRQVVTGTTSGDWPPGWERNEA